MSEDTYRWTHYRTQAVWESLVGKRVRVTWLEDSDRDGWFYYRVEAADSDWVMLQGVEIPGVTSEAGQYEGGPIAVRLSDIAMAEVIQE